MLPLTLIGLAACAAMAQSPDGPGLTGTFLGIRASAFGTADLGYVYSQGEAGFTQAVSGARTAVDLTPGVASQRRFSGLTNGIWKNSRLGVKAEEELGCGLKAVGLLEFGLDLDVDSGLAKTRQSYVGLDTPWGLFTGGKLFVASTGAVVRNSALEAITSSPITTLGRTLITSKNLNNGTAVGTTLVTGAAAWWNNCLGWQSRDWGGFSTKAYYSFGETGSSTGLVYAANGASTLPASANTATASLSDNQRVSLGATYARGPWNVDVVYQGQLAIRTLYPNTGSAANQLEGGRINEWYLGSAYDLRAVKLMATFQKADNNLQAATSGNLGERLWSAGAIVPVSARGKVRLEFAKVSFHQGAQAQPVAALQRDGASTCWGLGYTLDLSRHTTCYALLTRTGNDANSVENDVNKTGVGERGASNFMVAAGLCLSL